MCDPTWILIYFIHSFLLWAKGCLTITIQWSVNTLPQESKDLKTCWSTRLTASSMWQASAESSSIFLYLNHCSSKIIWGTDSCSFFSRFLSTLIHQTRGMLWALPLSMSYTVYQSPELQFYSPLSRLSCSLKAPNRKRCTLRQPTFILITTFCYSYFIIIYFLNFLLWLLCKLYFIKGIETIKQLQVWHYLML